MCVSIAAAIANAVAGTYVAAVPTALVCVAVAFGVQWIAFVPAYLRRTEKFYDLTGSATYMTVIWLSILLSGARSVTALAVATLVTIWAARLGLFLFKRIHKDGKDGRFDKIKQSAPRFFVAWTLQGLWVSLTLAAALVVTTTKSSGSLSPLVVIGAAVWLLGFTVEVVADRQKSAFRRDHPNQFIDSGLWAWSRHPNYFGEIVLWSGIAIIATASMAGWGWLGWVSPLFVTVLLTRISGIPLLEKRADQRYGDDAAYRRYKARTSVLVPLPPRADAGAAAADA